MLKKIILVSVFCLLSTIKVSSQSISAQLRTFDDIFPNISESAYNSIFFGNGFVTSNRQNFIGTRLNSGLSSEITNPIIKRNLGFLVESITLIQTDPWERNLLDVYNALSKIKNLEGILYNSHRASMPIPLFEEATRIVSERQTTPIPDPPRARQVPNSETVFLRLKDANFGNSFYRADMRRMGNGLVYNLSNFRNLTYNYLLIPFTAIRSGNFNAQLYIEPVQEGILIYGLAGADVSTSVSSRVNMNSAISKRLEVIIFWVTEGIKNN